MVDLSDVSLVDGDTNLIPADDTNRAIPGNLEMQVAPLGDQISGFQQNFRIFTKFQDFGNLTKFQDSDQISGFQQYFNQISEF